MATAETGVQLSIVGEDPPNKDSCVCVRRKESNSLIDEDASSSWLLFLLGYEPKNSLTYLARDVVSMVEDPCLYQ